MTISIKEKLLYQKLLRLFPNANRNVVFNFAVRLVEKHTELTIDEIADRVVRYKDGS